MGIPPSAHLPDLDEFPEKPLEEVDAARRFARTLRAASHPAVATIIESDIAIHTRTQIPLGTSDLEALLSNPAASPPPQPAAPAPMESSPSNSPVRPPLAMPRPPTPPRPKPPTSTAPPVFRFNRPGGPPSVRPHVPATFGAPLGAPRQAPAPPPTRDPKAEEIEMLLASLSDPVSNQPWLDLMEDIDVSWNLICTDEGLAAFYRDVLLKAFQITTGQDKNVARQYWDSIGLLSPGKDNVLWPRGRPEFLSFYRGLMRNLTFIQRSPERIRLYELRLQDYAERDDYADSVILLQDCAYTLDKLRHLAVSLNRDTSPSPGEDRTLHSWRVTREFVESCMPLLPFDAVLKRYCLHRLSCFRDGEIAHPREAALELRCRVEIIPDAEPDNPWPLGLPEWEPFLRAVILAWDYIEGRPGIYPDYVHRLRAFLDQLPPTQRTDCQTLLDRFDALPTERQRDDSDEALLNPSTGDQPGTSGMTRAQVRATAAAAPSAAALPAAPARPHQGKKGTSSAPPPSSQDPPPSTAAPTTQQPPATPVKEEASGSPPVSEVDQAAAKAQRTKDNKKSASKTKKVKKADGATPSKPSRKSKDHPKPAQAAARVAQQAVLPPAPSSTTTADPAAIPPTGFPQPPPLTRPSSQSEAASAPPARASARLQERRDSSSRPPSAPTATAAPTPTDVEMSDAPASSATSASLGIQPAITSEQVEDDDMDEN